MADEKFNIEVAVNAQLESLNKIQNAIGDLNQKLNGLSEGASDVNKVWSGAMYNIGAKMSDLALKFPSFATAAIQAFGQQEAAVQKLAAAIRSQGGNVSEVLPIMSSFASEMQRITTYGDEQVLAMQSMATAMGVSADQMNLCIQGAIGLTNVYGIGLNEAVRAAAAVVQGKTEKLNELIPALSKCKSETEKYALAEKAMKDGFAQAKAEAETTAGKLKQAANAWGDLAEVAGGTFAPVAVDVANALKFICEWFSKNQEFSQLLIGSLSSLAVGFAFSKIGGLASVAALFKMVASGMSVAKAASDGLNASLRANPLGIAVTAVSAFGMVVAHLHSKEKERYEQNIEQSREYRDGIDAEINAMKQWGISAENNKKRTAEVAAEIAKLKAEQAEYERANIRSVNTGSMGGIAVYIDPAARAQLDNYRAKIEKLEERQKAAANAKELDALAVKRHAEVVKAANEILDKSEQEMRAAKSATEALNVTRKKYASTEKEIAELDKALKSGNVADSQRIATAERLSQARKELLELGKKEIEQQLAIASSQYDVRKTAELKKQNELELQLAGARLRGETENAKYLENNLADVKIQQKRLDLISSYVSARKGEIKTSDDLKQTQADAARYANAILEAEKERASTEKWLAAEVEGNKTVQRGLEMDILRARASGNEELAKEIEGKLRVSQIASEIFEAARKEGMSRKELESLMETARGQAQERYELEKSVSDELERQNLAKDAQSKIEDILLANKIEQLKAEGKITEARELEREREIKRTLAGLNGVSDEDKEKLANTMRQTNSYRDKQEKTRFGGGTGIGYRSGSESSFGSSAYRYGDSLGGAAKYSGPTPARRPRPASVSAKYLGLYDDWRANGGSRSGVSWTDYRNSRRAEVDAAANAEKNYQKNVAADANTPVVKQRARASNALAEITQESESIASRITLGGAMNSITKNTPQEAPRKSPKTNADTVDEIAFNASRRGSKTPPDKNISSRQDTQNLGSPSAIRLLSSIEKTVKSIASS